MDYFSFGGTNEIYGKPISIKKLMNTKLLENDEEILILERNDRKFYLKRFYG